MNIKKWFKHLSRFSMILTLGILSSSNLQASQYWLQSYTNTGNHFIDTYYQSTTMRDWNIESNDIYLSGRFAAFSENFILAIKPGQQHILMHHLTQYNEWWNLHSGNNSLGGLWTTQSNDINAIGDFDGDGVEEILFANPNGFYSTLKLNGSPFSNYWTSIQSATNGNIDNGDKLIAGDYDGDGKDEVLLIKTDGSHYTMQLNTSTQNWDILSSANNGKIYWWNISLHDKFIAGDFNGDGKDELLAVNKYGSWHHTMHYNNNQWLFLEGSGNGKIGSWNISPNDRFLMGDFNGNEIDKLLVINPVNGWSHTIGFNNNQWQWLSGNNGNGAIDSWMLSYNDHYVIKRSSYSDRLFALNPNGWWKVLRY